MPMLKSFWPQYVDETTNVEIAKNKNIRIDFFIGTIFE
jgi:hypothetical protein